jgi:hypothetical protein
LFTLIKSDGRRFERSKNDRWLSLKETYDDSGGRTRRRKRGHSFQRKKTTRELKRISKKEENRFNHIQMK